MTPLHTARTDGQGRDSGETMLIVAATLLSVPLAAAAAWSGGADWLQWQWIVVLALAADLGGGMVANMLPATKRWYHPPYKAEWRYMAFAALHLHLPVMALMLPGWMPLEAAWQGYIWMLGGATLMLAIPAPARLPAGATFTAIGTVLLARVVPLDGALGWMPLVLFLKILAGHMVPPERP